MNDRLKTTLQAWPVITIATIALCYITKIVAGWFGIELPDQENITVVRQYLEHMFDSRKYFFACMNLLGQVLVILPAAEESIFRYLFFMLPNRKWIRCRVPVAIIASVLFSAAHYIVQPFPDAAFIALFFFGLAQCWLYWKTDRIWCPMLNHCLFNLTNLVLLLFVS